MSSGNYSKARVFIYLGALEQRKCALVATASKHTGITKASLATLLPRWVKWRYLERHQFFIRNAGKAPKQQWGYRLTDRGRYYLERMPTWYPQFEDAKREVEALKQNGQTS